MSYSFNMLFTSCEPKNVLDKCLSISKSIVKKPYKYIDYNRLYIPSEKYDLSERIKSSFNDMWLYRLFNFNFVYWEKYNILGLLGENYGDIDKDFDTQIYFQNSVDQNYDYDVWNGIPYFEGIATEIKSMPKEYLITISDYDSEDIENDTDDYYKKCIVYDTIFTSLDLDNYLYGKEGNFKRITINGIDSEETLYEIKKCLRLIVKG